MFSFSTFLLLWEPVGTCAKEAVISPLRGGVAGESTSPHLFQTSQSLLVILLLEVSDWTTRTNQWFQGTLPDSLPRPQIGPAHRPVSSVAMGTSGRRGVGEAPDVRWIFNMAAAVAAVAAARDS